jgi:RNA polymerase subunit RPABC4/transcription elongation factor Spt4
MVDPRCPNCSARVPADADWCSLCYASLRAQPAPAQVAEQPAPAYAASVAYDPLTAPASLLAELSELAGDASPVPVRTGRHAARHAAPQTGHQTGHPAGDQAGPPAAYPAAYLAPRAATWPCRKCTAEVPMEQDSCPVCGGGFLDAGEISVRLPLIGDAKTLEGSKKAWVIVGGAFAIIIAFLAFAMVIGLLI